MPFRVSHTSGSVGFPPLGDAHPGTLPGPVSASPFDRNYRALQGQHQSYTPDHFRLARGRLERYARTRGVADEPIASIRFVCAGFRHELRNCRRDVLGRRIVLVAEGAKFRHQYGPRYGGSTSCDTCTCRDGFKFQSERCRTNSGPRLSSLCIRSGPGAEPAASLVKIRRRQLPSMEPVHARSV